MALTIWNKWLKRRRLTAGIKLEELFLKAVNHLQYVVVSETNPRIAQTVRCATSREDTTGMIDFVFTVRKGDEVWVIPLQLTMVCNSDDQLLRRKLWLAEMGEIALFWPGQGLSSRQFYEIIEKAAKGDKAALADVERGLELAFGIYEEKRKYFKGVIC